MLTTCGIYLYSLKSRKILVCHATRSPWNFWSIPKGIKEEDEDCYNAAVRELKEETGLDINKINILEKRHLPPAKYQKQDKILESFLIITDTSLDKFKFSCSVLINNSFPEVDKWKLLDIDKEDNLLHESQRQNIGRVKIMIEAFLLHSKIMI